MNFIKQLFNYDYEPPRHYVRVPDWWYEPSYTPGKEEPTQDELDEKLARDHTSFATAYVKVEPKVVIYDQYSKDENFDLPNHAVLDDHPSEGKYFNISKRWLADLGPFDITYSEPNFKYDITDWEQENVLAAQELLLKYENKLTLFYDGSIEARAMLLAFAQAGRIPTVYAFTWGDAHDKEQFNELNFITQAQIHYDFSFNTIELDPQSFWEITAPHLANSYKIIDSRQILLVYAAYACPKTLVLPAGLPCILPTSDLNYVLRDDEQDFITYKLAVNSIDGVEPAFFRTTPGQLASFLGQAIQSHEENSTTSHFSSISQDFVRRTYEINYERLITSYELDFDNKMLLSKPAFKDHEIKTIK